MLTKVTHAVLHWIEEHHHRDQLRDLLAKDDHYLEDIGVKRLDLETSMGLPHEPNAREIANKLHLREIGF